MLKLPSLFQFHLPFPDSYTLSSKNTSHPPSTTGLRNIRCVLQYKGTAYSGWQRQPDTLTVQEIVENCISRMTREPVKVKASGRTDAGVHALMQVINFSTSTRIPCAGFLRGLNSLLPKDIAVIYTDEVKPTFDAQFRAKSKTYIYLILNARCRSPFLEEYSWHVITPLDIPSMQEAGNYLLGKHDFRSFMGAGSSIKNTVRQIYRLEVKESHPFITIEIEANGFLKHMARNIVGVLVETGQGKRNPQDMQQILMARDRKVAGINAPAQGLLLKEVKY
ncbi:MAG: tRNA pseudouridine(38-40) synthase TruA [Candidatus Desulfofervidaceae bacterium]|nr:tRNA pseudouridine(38-40) synthase TruA [Candidatus Desulfofervidaceae bacterium]